MDADLDSCVPADIITSSDKLGEVLIGCWIECFMWHGLFMCPPLPEACMWSDLFEYLQWVKFKHLAVSVVCVQVQHNSITWELCDIGHDGLVPKPTVMVKIDGTPGKYDINWL